MKEKEFLNQFLQKTFECYAISKVLLEEFAELKAKITDTNKTDELAKLNEKINIVFDEIKQDMKPE